MAVEDLGRKVSERREGEVRVEVEGVGEAIGSREGGGGRGDVFDSSNQARLK